MHTYNFMNPNNTEYAFKNKEWVNPCVPNHAMENKKIVKSIIQMNKEQVKAKAQAQVIEGK